MSPSKRELQQKITGAKRIRKIAYTGLAVGAVVFLLGALFQFSVLFLLGYTVVLVCTGISSFITILNWQYNKTLKARMEKMAKQPAKSICPRCGTEVDKNEKYCLKCGKTKLTRKR